MPAHNPPPTGLPRTVPDLIYENIADAIDWLTSAFGFHERTSARAAGAVIVTELEDQPWGDRRYQAADPEGHQWTFPQKVRRLHSSLRPPLAGDWHHPERRCLTDR